MTTAYYLDYQPAVWCPKCKRVAVQPKQHQCKETR